MLLRRSSVGLLGLSLLVATAAATVVPLVAVADPAPGGAVAGDADVASSPLQSDGASKSIVDTVVDVLGIEREYDREPWEEQYLYVISATGALLLAGRILLHWRFDPAAPGFVPRDGSAGPGAECDGDPSEVSVDA